MEAKRKLTKAEWSNLVNSTLPARKLRLRDKFEKYGYVSRNDAKSVESLAEIRNHSVPFEVRQLGDDVQTLKKLPVLFQNNDTPPTKNPFLTEDPYLIWVSKGKNNYVYFVDPQGYSYPRYIYFLMAYSGVSYEELLAYKYVNPTPKKVDLPKKIFYIDVNQDEQKFKEAIDLLYAQGFEWANKPKDKYLNDIATTAIKYVLADPDYKTLSWVGNDDKIRNLADTEFILPSSRGANKKLEPPKSANPLTFMQLKKLGVGTKILLPSNNGDLSSSIEIRQNRISETRKVWAKKLSVEPTEITWAEIVDFDNDDKSIKIDRLVKTTLGEIEPISYMWIWPNGTEVYLYDDAKLPPPSNSNKWRIPTVEEWETVIYPNKFMIPDIEVGAYWSISNDNADDTWEFNISYGRWTKYRCDKDNPRSVRPVRDISATPTDSEDWTLVGNLEVWNEDLGQMNWEDATKAVTQLNNSQASTSKPLPPPSNANKWRLPSIEEWEHVLAPYQKRIPNLVSNGDYWSSTEWTNPARLTLKKAGLVSAWYYNSSANLADDGYKSNRFYVRPVRDVSTTPTDSFDWTLVGNLEVWNKDLGQMTWDEAIQAAENLNLQTVTNNSSVQKETDEFDWEF